MTCYPFLSGQFICGNKHCDEKDGLTSYEASVSFDIIDLLIILRCGIILGDLAFNLNALNKFTPTHYTRVHARVLLS